MTPEEILRPLLKEFELPRKLVTLLYLLVQNEIEKGYPSLRYNPEYDKREPALQLAKGLLYILPRLPPLKDAGEGQLDATLYQLAGITDADVAYLYNLCTPVEYHQHLHWKKHYEEAVEEYQRDIDRRQKGQDVSWERSQLRHYRQLLKQEKEPEHLPYLTDFWGKLLHFPVSFDLPARNEHTHILGNTGSGKTQLLQQLILSDLKTDAAVIVMTLKGSLLSNISKLTILKDRLIVFSPYNPIPLNIFSMGSGENAVGLVNQMFAILGDAGTTARQTPMLNHCIRLLTLAPDTHLRSLYELMLAQKLPERYQPYVKHLDQSGQDFFNHRFADRDIADIKKALIWRIESVLQSPLVQKVFCQTEHALSMSEVMEEGKVLLIDTSWETEGDEGSSFIGRFFIALIAHAARKRTSKRPVYVYIDEAGAYVTPNIGLIMERTREMNVGLTIAHQSLSQLGEVRPAVLTNTNTKFVGRLKFEADAQAMASSVNVEYEALMREEALYFRVSYPDHHFMHIHVDAGKMERQPKRFSTYSLKYTQPAPPQLKAAQPEKNYEKGDSYGEDA